MSTNHGIKNIATTQKTTRIAMGMRYLLLEFVAPQDLEVMKELQETLKDRSSGPISEMEPEPFTGGEILRVLFFLNEVVKL